MRPRSGRAPDGRDARADRDRRASAATRDGVEGVRTESVPFEKTVAVVGAGRLGTALARALVSSGYHVSAVVSRRRRRARDAARLIQTNPRALSADELELLPSTHLLLVTTPDDALAATAADLASALDTERRRRVALHASGAHSSELLTPLRARGFRLGSMHPLVSISDPRDGAEAFRGGFFCVEGERAAASVARRIVRALGGHAFSIETRDKALYHAAAVMTSGHTVALFDAALTALTRCGLTPRQARAALVPLLRSTVENLSTRTPERALTGSYARADAATIGKHLAALADPTLDRRGVTRVYTILGEQSVKLAARAGVSRTRLREVERALRDASDADAPPAHAAPEVDSSVSAAALDDE
ncbi:MAG TPA: DUF2520 domain-containing protein [Pyrinomonadaceae bacterium]|nr:DUF2520 domain-containing protein [Pyrinomonadaceae bacterium]